MKKQENNEEQVESMKMEDVVTAGTIIVEDELPPSEPSTPRRSIIQPMESYLGSPSSQYRNYFDLEGNSFPDLFTRELKDAVQANDCDSKVKKIATARSARLYTDLIVADMQQKLKSQAARKKVKDLSPEELTNAFASVLSLADAMLSNSGAAKRNVGGEKK